MFSKKWGMFLTFLSGILLLSFIFLAYQVKKANSLEEILIERQKINKCNIINDMYSNQPELYK